jgi:hypothetical protein
MQENASLRKELAAKEREKSMQDSERADYQQRMDELRKIVKDA